MKKMRPICIFLMVMAMVLSVFAVGAFAGGPDSKGQYLVADPSGTCSPPLVDCDGVCVDLATDRYNCGECGKRCLGDCSGGLCWEYEVDPRYVDIKPGSCPNSLHVNSKGVLPVAILGTEDFDVTTIDPSTILIGFVLEFVEIGVSPLRWSYEDVATPFEGELCDCHDLDGDGYLDLTLKFDTQEVIKELKLTEDLGKTVKLTIFKEEHDGASIMGKDCVRVLGPIDDDY